MLVEGNIQAQGKYFLWVKPPSVPSLNADLPWYEVFSPEWKFLKYLTLLLPAPFVLRGERVCCPSGWKAKTAEILFCPTSQLRGTEDTALGIGGFDNQQKCHIPGFYSIMLARSGVAASCAPESFIHTGSTAQPMVFEKPKKKKYLLSRPMLPKRLGASTRRAGSASWVRKQPLRKEFLMNWLGSKSIHGTFSSLLIPLWKRNIHLFTFINTAYGCNKLQ